MKHIATIPSKLSSLLGQTTQLEVPCRSWRLSTQDFKKREKAHNGENEGSMHMRAARTQNVSHARLHLTYNVYISFAVQRIVQLRHVEDSKLIVINLSVIIITSSGHTTQERKKKTGNPADTDGAFKLFYLKCSFVQVAMPIAVKCARGRSRTCARTIQFCSQHSAARLARTRSQRWGQLCRDRAKYKLRAFLSLNQPT